MLSKNILTTKRLETIHEAHTAKPISWIGVIKNQSDASRMAGQITPKIKGKSGVTSLKAQKTFSPPNPKPPRRACVVLETGAG